MAFNFDIVYVKGRTIPYVDARSRLTFVNEQKEINVDTEEILYWVETDALPIGRLKEETLQDPVLSRISDRIKREIDRVTVYKQKDHTRLDINWL